MMMMMMKTHAPLVNGIVNKLCAWRHNMPPSPASWQYLFARWHLFRHVGYLRHQHQVDLWPFDLESRVRIACDVGYLCANFSLPRPLCSRVRPDVRDRQTDRQTSDRRHTSDRRQTKASLNASALWRRRHNNDPFHSSPHINQTLHQIVHIMRFLW